MLITFWVFTLNNLNVIRDEFKTCIYFKRNLRHTLENNPGLLHYLSFDREYGPKLQVYFPHLTSSL